MKHAFVFPGQGSQFPGMGKDHYDNSAFAKKLFEQANEILGFRISDIMFNGTEADLKQTNVTQPAVFLHSIIAYKSMKVHHLIWWPVILWENFLHWWLMAH